MGKKPRLISLVHKSSLGCIQENLPVFFHLFTPLRDITSLYKTSLLSLIMFCACLGPLAILKCSDEWFSPVESDELDFHDFIQILKMPS